MPTTAAAAAPPPSHAPRTLVLLQAPILPTLLRLAAPNVLVMLAQASTGLVETAFVGRLGTEALAGMAIVFPGVMLMQMMSSGAMGGAIAAAVARALGGGRTEEAGSLAVHALVINGLLGAAFTVLGLVGGPVLYRAMGAEGETLAAALRYSNTIFAGAIILWLFNALASCIRGSGNMLTPAAVIVGGAVLLVPVSPCLIFGFGPIPALGIAGGGVAMLAYYAGGLLVLLAHMRGPHGLVRLRRTRLRAAPLWTILRVGLLASLVTVQTHIIVTATTALVAPFGPGAIAGYGTATRLDYLLIPLTFGLGAPLVALVGTNLGAGQYARALRAAWTGAALAFVLCGIIGLAAAVWPRAWLGLFGQDPAMLAAGSAYLRDVAPFFPAFGASMALYFASQGAGRMLWPLVAAVTRTVIAVGGGWLALRFDGRLSTLFLALAAGVLAMAAINAAAIALGAWAPKAKLPHAGVAA